MYQVASQVWCNDVDDGDELVFSITGGIDQSYFEIVNIYMANTGYLGRIEIKENDLMSML